MFPNPQDALPLPARPDLDQYRKLAKELVKACRSAEPDAFIRWSADWVRQLVRLADLQIPDGLPVETERWISAVSEFAQRKMAGATTRACALADAQFVIARSHGFASWPKFSEHIAGFQSASSRVQHFEAAADAIVHGDLAALRLLLHGHPELVTRRSTREHHATLLHYVSANGVEGYRQVTPANIVEVAETLLQAGAEVDAEADVYGGGCTTLGLVATSVHPQRAGVQEPLMQLLLDHGASIDRPNLAGNRHTAVTACLANGQPRAAEFLATRGASLNLEAAAGIGSLERVQGSFGADGTLQAPATREQLQRGFLWACMYGRQETVEFLLDHGADLHDPAGIGATGLHWAVGSGELPVIQLLLARGAPLEVRNTWGGTVLEHAGWAFTNGDPAIDFVPVFETLLAAGAKLEDGWLEWLDKQTRRSAADRVRLAEVLRRYGAARKHAAPPDVADYERLAADMVTAYATGGVEAMQRIRQHFGQDFSIEDFRAMVWRLMYKVRQAKGSAAAFQLPEAQEMIARSTGFPSWTALLEATVKNIPAPGPAYTIDKKVNRVGLRRIPSRDDWDTILGVMKERRIPALEARMMTDDALARVAELDFITSLSLGGSRGLSDDGLQVLARMPQLEHLELSEYPGGNLTDRGLQVLRHLPNLKKFEMTWQKGITDAGAANLRFCEKLEEVDLMGSPTGDGAIAALRGKPKLRRLRTGRLVTDAGLPLLQEFPLFKTSHAAASRSLRSREHAPTSLLIDGPFTDEGFSGLAGLEGVFELDLFWHVTALTPAAFAYLVEMPNLSALGCDGALSSDEALRHIASIPHLRTLRAQEAVATDDGFEALSQSKTLEAFWGRVCPNFGSRGFAAFSRMPRLKTLGIGCKNVDDAALALLPRFPALREITPIDFRDDGFRHIGRCENLERLTCMYCRDTTDVATGHIAGLRLKHYYAGLTQITDRSLEILGRMATLEDIELHETKLVSDAGLAHLAKLPRLRNLSLTNLPLVTLAGTQVLPARVRVNYQV